MKKYNISIFTFGILLITSFVPVVYVILLYINGGIIAILEDLSGIDAMDLAIPLNLLLTILCVYLYFKSDKVVYRILESFFTFFFINAWIVFSFSEIFGIDDSEYYYIQFILIAFITSTSLLGVDYLKNKAKKQSVLNNDL